MGHVSSPEFRTFHSLRIKGFATVETIVEMTELPDGEVAVHLETMSSDGHAQFRAARALWQLTPDGRVAHGEHLANDVAGLDVSGLLGSSYVEFLDCNVRFKELCGDWQLRDGEPNDHSDAAYDAAVLDRLDELHAVACPIAVQFGDSFERFAPYGPRLDRVLGRLRSGESNMFTGVMCGSYHDVWMELHEDLILTQGIDRAAEGSF
jgi:hypothetical protein